MDAASADESAHPQDIEGLRLVRVRRYVALGAAALAVAGITLAVICGKMRLPPCVFHEVTGWYCPGCGSTRAVLRLLHGDVAGALQGNVLLFVIMPYVLFLAGSQVMVYMSGGRYKPGDVPNWAGYAVAAVLAFYWIARNIPLYPFTLLAPE